MGADLYINSIQKKVNEQYQPLFGRAVKARNKITDSVEFLSYRELGYIVAEFDNPYQVTDKAPIERRAALEKLVKRANAAQKIVSEYYSKLCGEGYFRDSYNGTAVMAMIGLSWWENVIPMLDSEGNLVPEKAEILLAVIKERKVKKVTVKLLKENHCKVDDKDNSTLVWNRYFVQKKKKLEEFLTQAIELKEPIYCSL